MHDETHKCIFDNLPPVFHNDIFIVFLHILVFWGLISLANYLIEKFSVRVNQYKNDYEFTKQINTLKLIFKSAVDTVLVNFAIMYILNKLGIDIRPILAAAGVVGVAVGFGARRFVEDVITGIIILMEGQIRVGDVVEISGKVGSVEKLDLKLVVLRDMNGCVHYIRNGMIDIVTNMTRDFSYAVFDIGVAYKENVDRVMEVMTQVGEELRNSDKYKQVVLEDIEILGVDKLADSAVVIKARIKTQPMKQWAVEREFNRLVKNKFDELGIEIPFPQLTVHSNQ